MKRAAVYIRVSTGRQDEKNQIPNIRQYAEANGITITETYADHAKSAYKGHQPELARLLDDIRTGRRVFDCVIIWSCDRLTRGGAGPLIQLLNTFERLHAPIVSVKEPLLAIDGPTRDLFAAIIGFFGHFESKRRSERTLEGLDTAKRKGKRLGRPPGSKDKAPRHRAGYLRRWAGKSVLQNSAEPKEAGKATCQNSDKLGKQLSGEKPRETAR